MTLLQYLKYITKCIVSNYKQLTITKIMLIITELVVCLFRAFIIITETVPFLTAAEVSHFI